MRSIRRQLSKIWYCLFQGRDDGLDPDFTELVGTEDPKAIEFGGSTLLNTGMTVYDGANIPIYSQPEFMWANLSPAGGSTSNHIFGTLADYTHVITTDWMDCPITESSILFIDKEPEYDDWDNPLPDYIVKRVSHSRHQVIIAVKRIEVGESA